MDVAALTPPPPSPTQAAATARQQVLCGNGTPALEHMMQWVEKGRWLYVAGVSRRFRAAYTAAHHTTSCAAQQTHYGAAVCTVNTLLFATAVLPKRKRLKRGEPQLRISALKTLGRAVGAWGSRAVLDFATGTQLDCEWGDVLVGAAAGLRPDMLAAACEAVRHTLGGRAAELALIEAALIAARSGDTGGCFNVLTKACDPSWDWARTVPRSWLGVAYRVSEAQRARPWPAWLGGGLCAVAAREGHLDTVRWFFENPDSTAFGAVQVDSEADAYMSVLAKRDPLYALMQRHVARVVYDTDAATASIFAAAAVGGATEVVRYLCSPQHGVARMGLVDDVDLFGIVFERCKLSAGHLETAKAMLSAGEVCFMGPIEDLILDMVRCQVDVPVELLKWARQNNIGAWTVDTLSTLLHWLQRPFRVRNNEPLVHWLTEQLTQLEGGRVH